MIEIIASIVGSGFLGGILTFFTTRKKYLTEIEQLRTDNFTKVVDRYQQIADDLQMRYEKSEARYNDLVEKYNNALDMNVKLQGDIQTLKIQVRKLSKIE